MLIRIDSSFIVSISYVICCRCCVLVWVNGFLCVVDFSNCSRWCRNSRYSISSVMIVVSFR